MNPLHVWKRPLALAEQAIGLTALGGLGYWWLGLTESTAMRVILSLLAVVAFLAGMALLIWRGRTRLAAPGGGGAIIALLLFAMSLAAAYLLVWWIPAIESLRGQVVSVALRFGAAFLLVVTFWSNLLGAAGRSATIEA